MKSITAGFVLTLLLGSTPFFAHAAVMDHDGDGVANSLDPDMDGDGIPNVYEQLNPQLNQRFSNDGARDMDGDGFTNGEEYRAVTDQTDPNSNPDMVTGPALQKVFGFDAATGSQFGYSVDIEGDWAVIGAPHAPILKNANGADIEPAYTGAVYVYRKDDGAWMLQKKLVALVPDEITGGPMLPEAGAGVGTEVALTLMAPHAFPTVMASAPGIDSVFVFKATEDGWHQAGLLTGPDGEGFGSSLALEGTTAVIGSPTHGHYDVPVSSDFGLVTVYDVKSTSDLAAPEVVQELTACEMTFCFYGESVALDGDTLVVSGDYGYFGNEVYVYTLSGGVWGSETRLETTLLDNSYLGASVAVSGDRILVSDYGKTGFMFGPAGDIAEFTFSGIEWQETGAIYAMDLGEDAIGNALALDGDIAMLSSAGGDVIGLMDMAGTWTEIARDNAIPEDEEIQNFLGLDTAGGTAIVGAPEDFDGGGDAGAAYFIDLDFIP